MLRVFPCPRVSLRVDRVSRVYSQRFLSSSALWTHTLPSRTVVPHGVSQRRLFSVQADNTPPPPKPAVHDGMPRWPNVTSVAGLLRCSDWFGTCVFAVSGAVTAATAGLDVFGCVVVGTITAIGGGTIRDVLVLRKQPFWIEESEYIWMSILFALGAFFLWPLLPEGLVKTKDGGEGDAMFWGDTLGIGAFCVIGAQNGIRAACPPIVSAICGMMTATFGGLTRDVLTKRPVRILHSHAEIYAQTALCGATVYLIARRLNTSLLVRVLAGAGSAMLMRYWAWTQGVRLPSWTTAAQTATVKPKTL